MARHECLQHEGAYAGDWFVTVAPVGEGSQVLLNHQGSVSGLICNPGYEDKAMVRLLDKEDVI